MEFIVLSEPVIRVGVGEAISERLYEVGCRGSCHVQSLTHVVFYFQQCFAAILRSMGRKNNSSCSCCHFLSLAAASRSRLSSSGFRFFSLLRLKVLMSFPSSREQLRLLSLFSGLEAIHRSTVRQPLLEGHRVRCRRLLLGQVLSLHQ